MSIAARLEKLENQARPDVWSTRIDYDPETEIGTIYTLKDGKVVDTLRVKGFDLRPDRALSYRFSP